VSSDAPLVSVVLTTRDRPRLLPVALACFEHQTYANKELIVVDDGAEFPADVSAVVAGGVNLIRVPTATPLGIKLNQGVDAGRGRLCMKMDDDDWYAPAYLETSVAALLESERVTCRPTVVLHLGFLFFDLKTWQLHESTEYNAPGATLMFSKDDWRNHPFRPVPTDEDTWFFRDQINSGAVVLPVKSPDTYVAIRHRGHRGTFRHTWTYQGDGRTMEQYLANRPQYEKAPEALFPDWALRVYRRIHEEINGGETSLVSSSEGASVDGTA
jgi:glycosyltransferase involved in cell wall biosynthesis